MKANLKRSHLRGKKLDVDCHKANVSTHEFGISDNRRFCLGLEDASTEYLLPKCRECGAHVLNAKPIESGE